MNPIPRNCDIHQAKLRTVRTYSPKRRPQETTKEFKKAVTRGFTEFFTRRGMVPPDTSGDFGAFDRKRIAGVKGAHRHE